MFRILAAVAAGATMDLRRQAASTRRHPGSSQRGLGHGSICRNGIIFVLLGEQLADRNGRPQVVRETGP